MTHEEQMTELMTRLGIAQKMIIRAKGLRERALSIESVSYRSRRDDPFKFQIDYLDDTCACRDGFNATAEHLESEAKAIIDAIANPKPAEVVSQALPVDPMADEAGKVWGGEHG